MTTAAELCEGIDISRATYVAVVIVPKLGNFGIQVKVDTHISLSVTTTYLPYVFTFDEAQAMRSQMLNYFDAALKIMGPRHGNH